MYFIFLFRGCRPTHLSKRFLHIRLLRLHGLSCQPGLPILYLKNGTERVFLFSFEWKITLHIGGECGES